MKKTLFISSAGGHLSELLQMEKLIKKYDSYIITEKVDATKKLNKNYKNIYYLLFGTRNHLFSYLFIFAINIILSFIYYVYIRPEVIITTGVHTCVPMCYIGKFFGSKIIYIETFANFNSKTLTGKIVYPIVDLFLVQWKSMLEIYPKAKYFGRLY